MLREKFTAVNTYIKKEERSQIINQYHNSGLQVKQLQETDIVSGVALREAQIQDETKSWTSEEFEVSGTYW